MITITPDFLKEVFGSQAIKGNAKFSQVFEQVLYLYKDRYLPSRLGNNSLTMAFSAMEFVLNAEVYFTKIGSRSGKSFINDNKNEFLKYFDYESLINKIGKGDTMLFLYNPLSKSKRKLAAHGVIGKFHSLDHSLEPDNPERVVKGDLESTRVVIRLEISNSGIIDLAISDMAYFGRWYGRRLEIVI